ncbi:MAG: crotonase/enoyl-CoA hydratase family protein [Myxococcota bacterium]
MSDPILLEQNEHVATLTLNRPESRNPISDLEMVDAITGAAERINRDKTVRVLVITGAGKAFSAGGNVKHMRDKTGMFAGSPAEISTAYRQGIQRIPRAIFNLEVPTIAAVNGAAVGAGCDLAMMCDIRLAGPHAKFAESFVKLGIIPGDGGAWFLSRVTSSSRAAEMLFTGEAIDADTAAAWGIVSKVCPGDTLLDEAQALAARIAVNPPWAVRMTKRLLRASADSSLDSMLNQCANAQALAHHTRDHQEALSAFFDKRTGDYLGE